MCIVVIIVTRYERLARVQGLRSVFFFFEQKTNIEDYYLSITPQMIPAGFLRHFLKSKIRIGILKHTKFIRNIYICTGKTQTQAIAATA